MNTFLLIIAGAGVLLILLFRAGKNISLLKDRFLDKALSSIQSASQELTQQSGRFTSDPSMARKYFSQRAAYILQTYCEQMYIGVENTPAEQYAALRGEIEKALRKL